MTWTCCLLDKTGTITLGSRQAAGFIAAPGVTEREVAEAAVLSSLADETPEGRSILAFARDRFGIEAGGAGRRVRHPLHRADPHLGPRPAAGQQLPEGRGGRAAAQPGRGGADRAARGGGPHRPRRRHAAAVAKNGRLVGAIELKDIVKTGMRARFDALRRMGIRTVMVTGDNRLTAAAIAAEAGVDDFIAEATPEDKLAYIRRAQAEGRLVARLATAPTMRRRWPRPMSGSRCRPGPRRRARPATWSTSTAIPRS